MITFTIESFFLVIAILSSILLTVKVCQVIYIVFFFFCKQWKKEYKIESSNNSGGVINLEYVETIPDHIRVVVLLQKGAVGIFLAIQF